jgi:cytochrome b6-f complex iron-sulfur subunit
MSDDDLSLDRVARLDAYLDDAAPASAGAQELAARMIAAQLRPAEEPSAAFLQTLEARVAAALPKRPRRVSRRVFFRGAAALAGGAALGEAVLDRPPGTLVTAANGQWYDVAAVDEVAPGGAKPFTAGGIEGYLLNHGDRLSAVSGICTHMGCRVTPSGSELRCLCHGSRFSRDGLVVAGLAPRPLPAIDVRVQDGRVYARGTRQDL